MSASLTKKILLVILVVSAILRVGWLPRGDTVSDEVFYGFRAVDLLDFDEADKQTTPLEWWDPAIPSWTKLSFHDHPPLVFLVQHVSIKLFGENNFALRLPSALLGIASIYLVFLLGSLLFSSGAGLISAGLLSVTVNHVYISRIGMQESYVIFFMLLASYFFIRAVRNHRSFIPAGIAIGFALLTKYNAFILFPLFGTYLLLYHRASFRLKSLWISIGVALLIFSPVIVYNLMLYRTVGHFDFQFSYVFGQNPAEWRDAPGKEIGSLADRIGDFVPRLISTNSWVFLVLVLVSLVYLRNNFVLLAFAYLLLLLSAIGPSFRFLTMLTPFFALSAGAFLEKKKYMLWLLIPVLLFEVAYSVNNQIRYYPVGPQPWFASRVRQENANWGYNALGDYFRKELAGKFPSATFRMRYAFIEKTQDAFIKKDEQRGYEPYQALIVLHGNFDLSAKLWVLERLKIYHGWPVIDFSTYQQYRKEQGADYYDRAGFKSYFVSSTNMVPEPEFVELVREFTPIPITNPKGDVVFNVYKK